MSPLLDPAVQALLTDLMRVLEPYPDVRAAVAPALGSLAPEK
jgi:hypothetical protein